MTRIIDSTPATRHPGPPLKLTPSMIAALSLAVSKGNYFTTACQLSGIAFSTLCYWLKDAEELIEQGVSEEDSLLTKLYYSLKRAEAEAEASLVEVVRESAEVKREWLPAMTFLERRHPDRWGRRERRDVNINETKRIQVTSITIAEASRLAPSEDGGLEEAIEGEVKELEEGKEE